MEDDVRQYLLAITSIMATGKRNGKLAMLLSPINEQCEENCEMLCL